jgi:hypothetical protein
MSDDPPIIDQIREAADEPAAAALLLALPLALLASHGLAIAQACSARQFLACSTYAQAMVAALHRVRSVPVDGATVPWMAYGQLARLDSRLSNAAYPELARDAD